MKELHSDTSNEPSLSLSQSPFSVVHIENKAEGTTYLVEFCDSEILRNNKEDVEDAGIPIIFSIKAGMSGSPQTEIKFTQINQDELLTVIVQAMDRRGMISRNDVNLFKINGATYSFYYSDEDMNNISNFELIDIQTDRSAAEFLNTALLNNPTIRVATRHYNGTDKSIESIIKQWFTDRRGLKKLLRTVFTDIQNGKTTTALSRQQIIEVLNSIDKTKNATDDIRSATTEDLINTIQPKLASKGINIEITTEVERQAIADANSRLRLGGEEQLDGTVMINASLLAHLVTSSMVL